MIGHNLVEQGLLTEQQLTETLSLQQHLVQHGLGNFRLGALLVAKGLLAAGETLDSQDHSDAETAASIALPLRLRQTYGVVPVGVQGGVLYVGAMQPLDETARADIISTARAGGHHVDTLQVTVISTAEALRSLRAADADTQGLDELLHGINANPESDSIDLAISSIITDAAEKGASDIHLAADSSALECRLQFRVGSVLRKRADITPLAASVLATRIKSNAGMDFALRAQPQDGQLSVEMSGRRVDVRVSTLPAGGGESVVMRVLDPDKMPPLDVMYQTAPDILGQLQKFAALKRKRGRILLFSGPTGSGKSSAMYGVVRAMDRTALKVMTAEDPIEQRVPDVTQTPVNEAAGLTYARIVRHQLRQDPNVLVIGEMRDVETILAAIYSAETGHTVMSTVHADSVAETLARIVGQLPKEMRAGGLQTIARNLTGVVNQALADKLCTCARAETAGNVATAEQMHALGLRPDDQIRVKVGCPHCEHHGYKSRLLVAEAWFPEREFNREELMRALDTGNIQSALVTNGLLSRDGVLKRLVLSGQVDIATAMETL